MNDNDDIDVDANKRSRSRRRSIDHLSLMKNLKDIEENQSSSDATPAAEIEKVDFEHNMIEMFVQDQPIGIGKIKVSETGIVWTKSKLESNCRSFKDRRLSGNFSNRRSFDVGQRLSLSGPSRPPLGTLDINGSRNASGDKMGKLSFIKPYVDPSCSSIQILLETVKAIHIRTSEEFAFAEKNPRYEVTIAEDITNSSSRFLCVAFIMNHHEDVRLFDSNEREERINDLDNRMFTAFTSLMKIHSMKENGFKNSIKNAETTIFNHTNGQTHASDPEQEKKLRELVRAYVSTTLLDHERPKSRRQGSNSKLSHATDASEKINKLYNYELPDPRFLELDPLDDEDIKNYEYKIPTREEMIKIKPILSRIVDADAKDKAEIENRTGVKAESVKGKDSKMRYIEISSQQEISPAEFEHRYRKALNLQKHTNHYHQKQVNAIEIHMKTVRTDNVQMIHERYEKLLKEEEMILHKAFDVALERYAKQKQILKYQMESELAKLSIT